MLYLNEQGIYVKESSIPALGVVRQTIAGGDKQTGVRKNTPMRFMRRAPGGKDHCFYLDKRLPCASTYAKASEDMADQILVRRVSP